MGTSREKQAKVKKERHDRGWAEKMQAGQVLSVTRLQPQKKKKRRSRKDKKKDEEIFIEVTTAGEVGQVSL